MSHTFSMSLIDFVKDAGEKLFGSGKAKAAMTQAAAAPTDPAAVKAANDAAGDAILEYIKAQGLSATGLTVTYDGATTTASVFGVAPDQATKEKIVLCAGNVSGVSKVNDNMRPITPTSITKSAIAPPPSVFIGCFRTRKESAT